MKQAKFMIKGKEDYVFEWKELVVIISLVVVIFGAFALMFVLPLWRRGPEVSGQFGDSFGVISSFFSALAFAGLIYTILLQRKELSLTRLEFKKQIRILDYQRFDSTFFQLLRLLNETVNGFPGGRVFFRDISNQIVTRLSQAYAISKTSQQPILLTKAWTEFQEQNSDLKHYFTNISVIINLIYESKKSSRARNKYLKIFLSQVSFNEKKVLINYFCIRSQNHDYFDLFKHLMFEKVLVNLQLEREKYLVELGRQQGLPLD